MLSQEHLDQAIAGNQLPQHEYSFENPDGLSIHFSIFGAGPLVVATSPGWGIGKKYLETHVLVPFKDTHNILSVSTRGTLLPQRRLIPEP
jgi:hypothetical protein